MNTNTLFHPKVSIIIPVYNGANYLREAIDSALAQTYKNIEVIVVNDGSNDNGNTESVALEYGDSIIYLHKENGGVSSALNFGIRQMSGDYFSWLSHDDKYGIHKIENQVRALSVVNDLKCISLCSHCFIDENSNILNKKVQKRFVSGVYTWQDALVSLLTYGAFSGCALFIPRIAFDECGLFDEELRYSQDMLMWISILLKEYKLVFNSDIEVYSRIHNKQLTNTGRDLFKKDSESIAEKMIPQLIKISDKKHNFVFLFAKRNARQGNCSVVKHCISEGRKHGVLGLFSMLYLYSNLIYGAMRPFLRRLYYRILVR